MGKRNVPKVGFEGVKKRVLQRIDQVKLPSRELRSLCTYHVLIESQSVQQVKSTRLITSSKYEIPLLKVSSLGLELLH